MRAYQKIIASGLILAGLAGLLGCDNKSKPKSKEIEESQSYFAELPMYSESGMAMATGDFDGDGDLDLIVGVRSYGYEARLYKFTNDGKGNLQQPQSYFAELPMYSESGMAMATGDFDGDGDLDLIVGVRSYGYEARLYKFTNDGKGNLSQ